MRFFLTTLLVVIAIFPRSLFSQDSLNITRIDGKEFIEHRVQEKETLYSLSRKYDVPIYRIIEHNPPTEFGLEIGTIINVPVTKKEEAAEKLAVVEQLPPPKETETPKQEPVVSTPREIKHTVETKQTLFSISRQYGVTIDEVRQWNNLSSNSLDIGQVLTIRMRPQEESLPQITIPGRNEDNLHIVEAGETLYSLSQRFRISIEELKRVNGLVTNELSIGQELVVGEQSDSTSTIVETVSTELVSMDSIGSANDTDQDAVNKAIEAANKYKEDSQPLNFEEVKESGVAEVIQGTDNTRKHLALHRTAKVGTILKVRNDMNDQEVFVRVLGRLPDNGANKNVLIKLSQAAYNRLGAIDPKFRVTISYIP